MSSTFINALEYYKDNDIKLNTYFPLLNYSNYSECYLFNSNVVIKMGQLNHIFSLYEKYLKNPILNNYIVPFYIYCLPMEKDFLPAHSLEIQ
jgi:hypothetical protein